MTLMKTFLGASAVLALTAGGAFAEPAIIFDLGGKFDKSFNESAFNGAQRWAEETAANTPISRSSPMPSANRRSAASPKPATTRS